MFLKYCSMGDSSSLPLTSHCCIAPCTVLWITLARTTRSKLRGGSFSRLQYLTSNSAGEIESQSSMSSEDNDTFPRIIFTLPKQIWHKEYHFEIPYQWNNVKTRQHSSRMRAPSVATSRCQYWGLGIWYTYPLPDTYYLPIKGPGTRDTDPPERTWEQWYLPPQQTITCENITFMELCLRAAKIQYWRKGRRNWLTLPMFRINLLPVCSDAQYVLE